MRVWRRFVTLRQARQHCPAFCYARDSTITAPLGLFTPALARRLVAIHRHLTGIPVYFERGGEVSGGAVLPVDINQCLELAMA